MNLYLVRDVMKKYNCTFSHAIYFIDCCNATKLEQVDKYMVEREKRMRK